MKHRILLVAAATLLLLVGGGTAVDGQEPSTDPEIEIIDADASRYPDVTFTVSVPVAVANSTLDDDAFGLTEDGKPRDVSSVLVEKPIDVALLIDTSGSMAGEPIGVAKAAATAFAGGLPATSRVAVTGFGQEVDRAVDFTTDRTAITTAINSLEASGETALYDALGAAAASFDRDARQAVVVLSDGGDTVSKATLGQARDRLAASNSSFYAIALETGESDFAGLEALADGTDGIVVDSSDIDALFRSFGEVANRLTNQYRLSYQSSAAGTTKLVVSLANNGGVLTTPYDIEFGPAGSGTGSDVAIAREAVATSPTQVAIAADAGFYGSRLPLFLGAFVVFIAIALATGLAFVPDRPRAHLGQLAASTIKGAPNAVSDLQHRATAAAERALESRAQHGAINQALDRAGVDLRPGEFVVLGAAIVGGTFMVFSLLSGVLLGIVAGGISLFGLKLWLSVKGDRRSEAFGSQLSDALTTMNGSLRSGHGVVQALDAVAREADAPMSEEMSRIVIETRIGRDVSQSLRATADRMDNEDFQWVARAIAIHRELGGDLAEILDNVAETIRERARVRAQVKALSAEGRLSGVILFALPFLVLIATQIINPEYIGELTGSGLGRMMLLVAGALMTVGGLWMRKLVDLKY